jgi:hypothetical protein
MTDPTGKSKMGMGMLQVLLIKERKFETNFVAHQKPQKCHNQQIDKRKFQPKLGVKVH